MTFQGPFAFSLINSATLEKNMWGHTNLWIRSNLRIAWISTQHLSAQAKLRPELEIQFKIWIFEFQLQDKQYGQSQSE